MLQALADGRIFGDRTGTGPVQVVGLHGWARDRGDLERALDGFSALNLDLPGSGASPPPPAPTGAAGYARVLADALDGALEGPVVAVGHSFGGRVAVCAAAARPDLISGLVLSGVPLLRPAGARSRPKLEVRVAKELHRRGLVTDARLERVRTKHGSDDYRNAHGVMRGVLVTVVNESYEDQLAALGCSMTLLWGADDTVVPVEVAERAQRLVAGAELVTLPGVDHDVPRHAPGALHDAAARLLESAPRS